MDDREGWRERVRDNRADGMTWWWWCSIWPIDSTLSGVTTPSQVQMNRYRRIWNTPTKAWLSQLVNFKNAIWHIHLWEQDNEGVFRISQISTLTGASPSDWLMSYPGHPLCGEWGGGLTLPQRYSPRWVDWKRSVGKRFTNTVGDF